MMNNLDFIRKLYNGKSCYSDHMSPEEIELLHIPSPLEELIGRMIAEGKTIFLTGNPGDGKTFIIKALHNFISQANAYIETDTNSVTDYDPLINKILECYRTGQACVVAVNEYPFHKLCSRLKVLAPEFHKELMQVKRNSIVYDIPKFYPDRIIIVDLNERSLLDGDRALLSGLLKKVNKLLEGSKGISTALDYNLKAITNPLVEDQILALFSLVAISGEHFAVRDIMGAVSYMMTASISNAEGNAPVYYYDALFSGANDLLNYIKRFDPIYLTIPTIDEQLWNGELVDGWQVTPPSIWPYNYEDDVEVAVACFESLKRKFYFENMYSKVLNNIQPNELQLCSQIFRDIDMRKRRIKEDIILAINKLFLPTDEERKRLRIWTTHSYDLSREVAAAVSSRGIESSELEILVPRPADWLNVMEYTPSIVLLRPRDKFSPQLHLDYDFLNALFKVRVGYPIGLLSSKFEQAAGAFLRQLDEHCLTEENEGGEIIIADRSKGYKKSIFIDQNMYSLSREEEP